MNRKPFCFAKLYDDMGLTKTYFGKRIIINTRNIHTLGMVDHGKLEPAICDLFEQHIKPKQVVIDVGANIGFLSLLAGHLVGPEGHVVSIEANPDVHAVLMDNIILNAFGNRFTTHQMAAYHEATDLTFTWNSNRDGSGRIVTAGQPGLAEKSCQVKADTLDQICADKKVDLIKIDTEGAEPSVLYGAQNIMRQNPKLKVIFEWNTKHIKLRGGNLNEFVDFLFAHFSNMERIVKAGSLIPVSATDLLSLSHSNLFAYN